MKTKMIGRLQSFVAAGLTGSRFCTTAFCAALLLLGSSSAAQNLSARREASRTFIEDTTGQAAIEKKLVDLALSGPQFQTTVHEGRINELRLKGEKNAWLNLLSLSTQYNDQSFSKTAQTVNFPRYFFGINIPLGILLSRTGVKTAKEAVEISKLNQEEKRRTLKLDVIAKYRQYRSVSKIISLENEYLLDVEAALLQSEENFRKGTATIEAYNSSQRTRSDALARIINLRLQQDLLRLDIERIIGTSLDTVVK
jgi:outer membrane protein TolC